MTSTDEVLDVATLEVVIADDLAGFYADPLGYVMYIFPWDTNKSIQLVELAPPYRKRFNSRFGPDVWACEFLDSLGAEIKQRDFDGRNAVDPIQFATTSGHGIGKSVMVAWLVKFIMDRRRHGQHSRAIENQDMGRSW